MRPLIYHDLDSILEITPEGEMICLCPCHGKRPVPASLAKGLKPLMRGRIQCKTREIMVPEGFMD